MLIAGLNSLSEKIFVLQIKITVSIKANRTPYESVKTKRDS